MIGYKKLAYSVERRAYRKTKDIFFSLLSAIRYPLSAKTRILLFIVYSLWFMAGSSFAQEDKFFEIRAKQFVYTPNMIKVNKGDRVRIRLISEDVTHGFFLDAYGLNTSAHPGQEGALEFVADKVGRFSFRCSVTCGALHPYMVGHLFILPNSIFMAGAFTVLLLGIASLIFALRKKQKEERLKLFGIIPLDLRFPLTKFKPLRALLKSRWFPFLPIVFNLFIFIIILLAGFIGGLASGNYNFGVMIVWILWWVLLMMFMVPIIGRFWCMMCPFPLIGDWMQRGKLLNVGKQKSWGLSKRWPNKWRNLWPLVILFWISTWFSGFFTVKPFATFVLLGAIILLAIILAIFFDKRTFCLFVCPVSGFQGLYANFSLFGVRSRDPEICKAHIPKTCVVGSEKGYGCPWMELPYEMNRNTYCGLCFECFKTCPYDNMDLVLRPFGQDLFAEKRRTDEIYRRRASDEAFKALTMVGIFLSFFLAFQGPYGHLKDMVTAKTAKGYLGYLGESFLVDFFLIPGSLFIFAYLSQKFSKNKEVKLKDIFVNFSYCLVPVGLAIWAAFSLGIILPNGSYLLHIISDPFAWGWNLFGTANFPWTPVFTQAMYYLQILVTLIGFIFALDFGFKFSLKTYPTIEQAKRGWIPILMYLVIIHILFLKLFTG